MNGADVLKAFRSGYNTLEIAKAYKVSEPEVCRLLHMQREAEREKQPLEKIGHGR